jgi:hypothetical protein
MRSEQKEPQQTLALNRIVKLINLFEASRDNDKLAKNRESARNSRKRKKIYLELLENKVTLLSEQLETYKTVFERNQALSYSLQTKIN